MKEMEIIERRKGSKDFFVDVTSIGGTITRVFCFGKEIIFPKQIIGDKSRGGIILCLPFFGSPTHRFNGIERHGWLRNQNLNLKSESDTEIVFEGRNERTNVFPWELTYDVLVSVFPLSDMLSLKLLITRTRDGIKGGAPINPAVRPYFSVSGKHSAVIAGQRVIREFNREPAEIPEFMDFHVSLGNTRTDMILGGSFRNNSRSRFWSDAKGEYVCVESILADPKNVNTDRGIFLQEGGQIAIACSLMVSQ